MHSRYSVAATQSAQSIQLRMMRVGEVIWHPPSKPISRRYQLLTR